MPTHLTSSFASAAAGQAARDARGSGRTGEPRGTGDWARKDARPLNGTLTLRRTTANPNAPSAPSSGHPDSSSDFASYHNDVPVDTRYSKDSILKIYDNLPKTSDDDVKRLYVNGWNPEASNGSTGRGWGKGPDARDASNGPEVCWDQTGEVKPMSLEEMSEAEKAVFASDVNSPLKPPPQTVKEAGTPGVSTNGRRNSLTQGGAAGYPSPTPGRPGNRRRETSDYLGTNSLASPATLSRFNRDEPSPFFRKTADRDTLDDGDDGAPRSRPALPFNLTRSSTTGAPSSPWSAGATASMGAFGSFALPTGPGTPTAERTRPGFGRGESRLAHLMPKDGSEEVTTPGGTKQALRSEAAKSWRDKPQAPETDPFDDIPPQGGSAALGGQDLSPPPAIQQRRAQGYGTPSRGASRQTSGDFGAHDRLQGFRDGLASGAQTPYGRHGGQQAESPTETNPYASPSENHAREEDAADNISIGSSALHQHLRNGPLGGSEHSGPFGNMPRGFPYAPLDHPDRSATSSVTGNRGFPSLNTLGGLGSLGGWPTSANPIGTPDRERSFQSAFGNSIFGPATGGDGGMQSPGPSLSGLGGFGATGGLAGSNTIGRGSKLGSLFPAAMQAQMHNNESEHHEEQRQTGAFGAIGRSAFGPPRETDSPLRSGKGVFDDLLQASDFRTGSYSSGDGQQSQGSAPGGALSQIPGQAFRQSPHSADANLNLGHLPPTQQRTMVMPDRMRWVYLDPQGQTQGPWSGLEMHDWYKAAFFTPDLSVKKLEDAEFEPLGQLIRRIGNSREPFLVPQIGVPHGPASNPSGAPFTPVAAGATPGPSAGAVQPPFAGAFPSFGTTLTAEQQNNLERRKQEEQYLMARQREFLAQQQVNMKQMQMQGGLPSVLHHHSSAHSLQSQPSFGSIASPIGPIMPQQLPTTSAGFFDPPRPAQGPSGMNMPPDFFREEEIQRLTLQDRNAPFGAPGPRQQLPPMFPEQREQRHQQPQPVGPPAPQQTQNENDPQGFRARLQEFEQLRAQHDAEQAAAAAAPTGEPIAPPQTRKHQQQQQREQREQTEPVDVEESAPAPVEVKEDHKEEVVVEEEPLTLTEQIQKAASAKPTPQPESPWAKVPAGLPMPFPPAPPQSTTPLPAPSAQRGRSNLPDNLNAGARSDRSRSETSEAAALTPSVAPWAKEPTEASKGPSLKEIQEAEAKTAAKREEAAAAARRAALEQEMRAQAAAPAPGLPTTSNWAASSPVIPAATTASPWAKATAAPAKAPSKKTLADIQREEENRKAKLAAAALAAQPAPVAAGGKRYADLASKPSAPSGPVAGSAWSTVGAGGKVKMPLGQTAPALTRPASSAAVPTIATRAVRPSIADARTNTSAASLATQGGMNAAQAEFNKWAKNALEKGLNTDINVDTFVEMLYDFPAEPAIIADAVYSNSQLMDGRRFGEEFVRRKKLAEKGVVESATGGATGFSTAGGNAATVGGWSEVAKKGPPKVEEPAVHGFKVVPNKKKGRK